MSRDRGDVVKVGGPAKMLPDGDGNEPETNSMPGADVAGFHPSIRTRPLMPLMVVTRLMMYPPIAVVSNVMTLGGWLPARKSAFASRIAWRSVPTPASAALVTMRCVQAVPNSC